VTDQELMKAAIALAEQCKPIAGRIPMVGAVIAVGGVIIGRGHRGTGEQGDDDHAERIALEGVVDRKQLPEATVYTTLEPCTPEVRSDPLNCCTELIGQAGVKRVFIGILDPNQGVRGKGLWALQSAGVDVELFPPELASQIRVLNHRFIKEQQTLGIRITNLTSDQIIKTYETGGAYELEGTFLNPPGSDVFALISNGDQWWPQPHPLRITGENAWSVKIYFGAYGRHTVAIVRASELGVYLVSYYRKVVSSNIERSERIMRYFRRDSMAGDDAELRGLLRNAHEGIAMGKLPKGIELQDQFNIIVEAPPSP
jgi:pyrimidine deaminase RibD-like protein